MTNNDKGCIQKHDKLVSEVSQNSKMSFMDDPQSGWEYYHMYNAMQYYNTASLVMYDSESFSYVMPLFLMALQIS